MGRAFAALLSLLLLVSGWTPAAWGGGLKRFERAHTSNDDDDDDGGSSSSSSTSSSSSSSYSDEPSYDDSSSSSSSSSSNDSGGVDPRILLMVGCVIPLFTPACLHPAHHPSREPYHQRGLYAEPRELPSDASPAGGSDPSWSRTDLDRRRWLEVQATGFGVMNEKYIGSHDLDLTAFLGPVIVHAGWEHFYERVDGVGPLEHLNMINLHIGANLLGPRVPWFELYWFAGASAIVGEETTPAFDAGAELRVYPVDPMTIHTSAVFSVFEIGPLLVDTRWQLGVAFDRFELRAGPRWLYQGEAQGFWGPSAAFAARF